jgi:hypothetical protein
MVDGFRKLCTECTVRRAVEVMPVAALKVQHHPSTASHIKKMHLLEARTFQISLALRI